MFDWNRNGKQDTGGSFMDFMIFNEVMNLTQQFRLYGIDCETIHFDQYRNITITLAGGDVDVYFGTNEDILAKISALNDMLPELKARGLRGTLDLSAYNDKEKGSTSSFKLRPGPAASPESAAGEAGEAAEKTSG